MSRQTATKSRAVAALDAEGMRAAIAQIENHAGHNTEALLAIFSQGRGMKTGRRRDGSVTLAMYGISAASTDGSAQALHLWARKARRALLGVV